MDGWMDEWGKKVEIKRKSEENKLVTKRFVLNFFIVLSVHDSLFVERIMPIMCNNSNNGSNIIWFASSMLQTSFS